MDNSELLHLKCESESKTMWTLELRNPDVYKMRKPRDE